MKLRAVRKSAFSKLVFKKRASVRSQLSNRDPDKSVSLKSTSFSVQPTNFVFLSFRP